MTSTPIPRSPDLAAIRELLAKYQAEETRDHSGELKGWRGRPLWTKVTEVTQSDVDHSRVPSDLIVATVNALPALLDYTEALIAALREVAPTHDGDCSIRPEKCLRHRIDALLPPEPQR